MYLAQEFAQRAGVTVRTLHHYDRLGLLPPVGRSAGGYRLYGEASLVRLQQIVTLKYLGLPLRHIKAVLEGEAGDDLVATLSRQRAGLEGKRRHLDQAIQALARAEAMARETGRPDWDALKHVIEVIAMQQNKDWMGQYYTEEQLQQLRQRYLPLRGQAEEAWATLIKEVEAALHEDPAGPHAQALAARWQALIDAFTGGDPGIEANLKKLYADKANWPATFKRPYSDEVEAFINKALGR